ncbi:MAG: hypothetical protein Q4P05_03890 [Actinomycetaceae bacterium]|nr:hypothetical protein [Actinomycetaceae bacterium]
MEPGIRIEPQEFFEQVHDYSMDHPAESDALVAGLSVFAWYAMPDIISSPTLRFIGKSTILAGVGSYLYHLPGSDKIIEESGKSVAKLWKRIGLAEQSIPVQVAAGLAASSALLWVNSLTERYILHRGERKKAKGKKFPHIKQGLILGGVCALAVYAEGRRS